MFASNCRSARSANKSRKDPNNTLLSNKLRDLDTHDCSQGYLMGWESNQRCSDVIKMKKKILSLPVTLIGSYASKIVHYIF